MKKNPKKAYRDAKSAVEKAAKKPLGEGSRFEAAAKSAEASGTKNPEAAAGRRKNKK